MKKEIVSIFLLLVLLIGVLGYKSIEASTEDNEIRDIIEVMEMEDISIEEWSLYTKGRIYSIHDERDFKLKVEELINITGNFNWNQSIQGDEYKAHGVRLSENGIKEKIILATTLKNNTSHTYLIYGASGSGWNPDDYKEFFPIFNNTKNDILLGDSANFSCVKGFVSDTIEEVLHVQIKKILNKFNDAKMIELINEETFVSVTAYNEKWDRYLPTINGKMNIQVAMRHLGLGGKTTVVVGTPIITSEY